MPLLEQQYWNSKISLLDLVKRVEALVHQPINPYSPANNTLYELYKTDLEGYNKIMKEQSLRFSKRDEKYYKNPCIHIEIQK